LTKQLIENGCKPMVPGVFRFSPLSGVEFQFHPQRGIFGKKIKL
jgi:hypothetical protein